MTGALTTPAPPREAAGDDRRNFRLGVGNGAIYQLGEAFIDSSTVIPVFMSQLTRSSALIGLATSLNDMGWLLPQCFVAPRVSRLPRQLPVYRRAAFFRAGALALFAALVWPLHDQAALVLGAFFACYSVYCFGAGVSALSFMEVVGRTVPHPRLGSYFSQRMFWGGSFAALGGIAVRKTLELPSFELKFSILFGLATVFVTAGYALFSSIREPALPPAPTAESTRALLREGLVMLRRDPRFRRLLIARSALSVWFTANPFIVLFGVQDLGGGARAAGTFLLARMSGYVVANLAWHSLSRRQGNRAILRVATLTGSLLLFGAFAVAAIRTWWPAAMSPRTALALLVAITALGGAMNSGMLVGYASQTIELAPPGRRPAFISLMNTFVGTTMLLPMLGGALKDRFNAPVVFLLCAVAALVAWRAARRLPAPEPGHAEIDPRVAAERVTGDEP